MLQNLKKRQEGFTIIEVMIVLVIAAVILLIVFLAVPALQRNSRNTTAKNEAARVMAAASEWSSNNNGTVPVAANIAAINGLTNNKTFTTFTIATGAGNKTPTATAPVLATGQKCNASAGTAYSTADGTTRQIALVYWIENNTGNVANCLDSGL